MVDEPLIPDISDAAVRKATAKSWPAWLEWIDERGGRERSHQDVVRLLRDEAGVESGWWQQAVANGYEKLIGRRSVGETQRGGFQVGVRRTVAASPEQVWRLLVSPQGLCAWLGDDPPRELRQGQLYELADGTTGEIRIVKEGSHLRLTWRPRNWPRHSTIQVRLLPAASGKTAVSFHQERLPDAAARAERREWFKRAADSLAAAMGAGESTRDPQRGRPR
jgi:uncharacterized protein YndB with AHSA1/START domain